MRMRCIRCKTREAIFPDRDSMSQRKVICVECHKDRVREDLERILDQYYAHLAVVPAPPDKR